MKKFVLRLELFEEEDKRRALKTVSTLSGIDEITIDMKGKKLTVVGTVDPITVVSKLRKKNWTADIISVGPAKEDQPKKEEAKKDEGKKEESKKEDAKSNKEDEGGANKKQQSEEGNKKESEPAKKPEMNVKVIEAPPQFMYGAAPPMMMPPPPYRPAYYYQQQPMNMNPNYYHYVKPHSMEENPNACVIC